MYKANQGTFERTKMYKSFIKSIKEDAILSVDVSSIREDGPDSVYLDIPCADTQVIAQNAVAISNFIGNKNQNIYIERFGNSSTTIVIENPTLKMTEDGTMVDYAGRDRTGYGNVLIETNVHELPRNTKPLSSVEPLISEDW